MYPVIVLMLLTLFLYIKNYLDNKKAYKNKLVKADYFKIYQGVVPETIELSRQTLKNQFELPVFFYFLVVLLLIFNNITIIDLILAWLFVLSRYIHCYIRLTSNYIPFRAGIFSLGLLFLVGAWINFLANIL